MKGVKKYFIATTLGLTAIAFASQASAQNTAQRDAAIAECIAKSQKEYPDTSPGGDVGTNRAAVYKSCMASKGLNP
jgi:hypothetical protein